MKRKTYQLDGFPYEKLNRYLHLELEHPHVRIHAPLWRKIETKHPESLSLVENFLHEALLKPDYVGQAPQHFENIEMIKRTPSGPLLVAVKIRNGKGFYCLPLIASAYVISNEKLTNRLHSGTLRRFK